VVAQAPVWARIGRSRVGFRHRGTAPSHRPWPLSPIPGSGLSTAQRVRGRIGLAVVFDSASWLIRRSRGHSGRYARGGAVVRLLPRAVLCEAGEAWMTPCGYGADFGRFFNAGHNSLRATTVDAGAHVAVENALAALRYLRRCATCGAARKVIERRFSSGPRRSLLAPVDA
jgi:hypothetical protein